MNFRRAIVFVLIAGVIVLILLSLLAGWVEKGLWMSQLGFGSVFWHLLAVRLVSAAAAFVLSFVYIWMNLLAVGRRARELPGALASRLGPSPFGWLPNSIARPPRFALIAWMPAFVVAAATGVAFYGEWDTYLRMRFGGSFGLADPLFGRDVGYMVFRLPFYQLVQNSLVAIAALALLFTLAGYALLAGLRMGAPLFRQPKVGRHLATLGIILLGSLAWGFYLDRFELVFARRGVVYGAGYVDTNVTLVSLDIMLIATVAAAVLLGVSVRRRRLAVLLYGLGGYLAIYVGLVGALPALVQRYKVLPDELRLETPYLQSNIDFTRKAYGIDGVEEKDYPGEATLTEAEIGQDEETIRNIRLWDWRPLLQTYRQTQEIRLYYQFYSVDVDRYHLAGGYHQVMLSARELASELPFKAQTWLNEKLQFTHGYGLVESFVSHIASGGLPEYLIDEIPPVSHYQQEVVQPAIYFGEHMQGYRLVHTNVEEFDYPKGNSNVYTHYAGHGGIPMSGWWKPLLFSWTRSDINLLLTSALDAGSRIQIWRDVQERVSKIAPFLQLDRDPYLVLSEGRLFWIQDAYTTSDHFPYSEPSEDGQVNYIRNSVKVIVDAYQGDVTFYVADAEDPVLRVYRAAFPQMFHDLQEMAPDLRRHIRYPEDLFSLQAHIYATYHMTVPQVFYNQEDLWSTPREKYAGEAIAMAPYYVLVRLPGTKNLQYLLMRPFSPHRRDNMIAWMAGKCDIPEYGRLEVYRLPKQRVVYGPIQIEAMIDQNTVISQQLSLWDQRGSRVIRGNLLVIPIAQSFLYVEPVYLSAEINSIPQLKRVIVAMGDKVEMQPTLDQALDALFGRAPQQEAVALPPSTGQQAVLKQAHEQLQDAERSLSKGDWTDFGKAMQKVEQSLTPATPGRSPPTP
jgi:uncharacterized membrane protein (UPF0182 family)